MCSFAWYFIAIYNRQQVFSIFLYIYGGTGNLNLTLKVSPDALIKLNKVVGMLE
ncbi:protein of unknown function [Tepidibacter aestuarii]|nr:protein of unknown function [Tepidibacter aestuarii]